MTTNWTELQKKNINQIYITMLRFGKKISERDENGVTIARYIFKHRKIEVVVLAPFICSEVRFNNKVITK